MSHRQYLHIFHIVEFSFFHVFRRHNILIIFIFLRYGYISPVSSLRSLLKLHFVAKDVTGKSCQVLIR